MKRILVLMFVCICGQTIATAQVAIGGDGTVTAGAALDLSKANGGLLLPQVASNPTSGDLLKRGMMIYNTTTKNTYTYDGAAWVGSEITINDGGSGSGAPAPTNPVLPGSCTDYNENSWRVGNVCIYPTEVTSVWSGTTGGCEIGWNVISYEEFVDAVCNQTNPTYPIPTSFELVVPELVNGDTVTHWLRDWPPMWNAEGVWGTLSVTMIADPTKLNSNGPGRMIARVYEITDRTLWNVTWVNVRTPKVKIRCTRPI